MNTLLYLAQSTYETTYYTKDSLSAEEAAALGVVMAGVFTFALITAAVVYVIHAFLLAMIFKKAGIAQWAAWVPFYNSWKLFELGGQHGALSILLYVPIANIIGAIFMIIAQYHVGLKLQKTGVFVLWAIFLPTVWYAWLAFDKSKWNDGASTAPNKAVGPKPAPAQ